MTGGYDVIVIGLGAMGSASAYHLARRGHRVLGLDAHERGHARGSSHGRSRMIRRVYAAGVEYVPLMQRAYALWQELEAESGTELLTITGGLFIGPPESLTIAGSLRSAREHGLACEYLAPPAVRSRFPGFRMSDDLVAVFDPAAGLLEPERCVGAHVDLAMRYGADLHHAEPVRLWAVSGSRVRVTTTLGAYEADRLIITTGPWAGEILTGLHLPLSVRRVVNVHFEPTRSDLFTPDRCPVYVWVVPEGVYYGFPALPGQGLKVGRDDGGEDCTPHTIRREVDPGEVESLRRVLERYMPGASGAVRWTLTCMYTNTPDRHFVIDRHPEHDQVVYACGFSGHGFKFSSVVGEVLADLAIDGATRHRVAFLSASRFRPVVPVQ